MQRRLWQALVALVVLLFVAVFVQLLRQFGSTAVTASLASFRTLWPTLVPLEMLRIGCEVLATWALLGASSARLPFARLLRGQLLGQALDVLMPAGRTSAETAKAVIYAPDVGWPQALAVGTALQLAVLSANAIWVSIGYRVGAELGLSRVLRVGLLGYAAVTCGLVMGVALFAIAPSVRRSATRVPLLHASLERFAELWVAAPGRLTTAVAAQLLGRSIQTLQLTLAVTSLGASPSPAQIFLTEAVYLVGAGLGELVPVQLGSTDAVFVLAAPTLGLTTSAAFAAMLALHAVQVVTSLAAVFGSCVLWWREPRRTQGDETTSVDIPVEAAAELTPEQPVQPP